MKVQQDAMFHLSDGQRAKSLIKYSVGKDEEGVTGATSMRSNLARPVRYINTSFWT
jgi:hypothetical protein